MVSPVHQVKLPPIAGAHGPQDGMVGNGHPRSKSRIALANHAVHAFEVFEDLRGQLRNGDSAGADVLRRFATWRKIPQPDDYSSPPSLAAGIGTCAGCPRSEAALEIFDCAAIGQI
jgi:hypothetical protein